MGAGASQCLEGGSADAARSARHQDDAAFMVSQGTLALYSARVSSSGDALPRFIEKMRVAERGGQCHRLARLSRLTAPHLSDDGLARSGRDMRIARLAQPFNDIDPALELEIAFVAEIEMLRPDTQ